MYSSPEFFYHVPHARYSPAMGNPYGKLIPTYTPTRGLLALGVIALAYYHFVYKGSNI